MEIRKDLMDYVFTLADGSLLHLEFQSSAERTLHRFLLYDTLLSQHTRQTVRTVVLYENQVTHAPQDLDIGSAQYHVQNIYLAHKDADATFARIEAHVVMGIFTPEDRFDLAFALHMRRSRSLEEMVHQSIALIERIPDHNERSYVAAIFVELSTRWLDEKATKQIRKWVERLDLVKEIIEEAVEKAVEEAVEKAVEKALETGRQEGRMEGQIEGRLAERLEFARKLLTEGESLERIAHLTGLSLAQVNALSSQQ